MGSASVRPKSSSSSALIGTLGLALLAGFIVWTNIGRAALAQKQLSYATYFPLSNSKASARLAVEAHVSKSYKTSEKLARSALKRSLTHAEALSVVGMNSIQKGDVETGTKLLKLSGNLSLRHSQTQAWLLERSLLDGNYQQSMVHADALLRRQKKQTEIFDMFALIAQDFSLRPMLIERFETKSDWRRIFFAQGDKVAASRFNGFEALVTGLEKSDAPVVRGELVPFTNLLVQEKQNRRAIELWGRAFPSDGLVFAENSQATLKWRSGSSSNLPTVADWKFREDRHITTLVYTSADTKGSILSLELARRALGEIARRHIIVPKGRLTLDMRSAQSPTLMVNAVDWSLMCLDNQLTTPMSPVSGKAGRWTIEIKDECGAYDLILGIKLGGLRDAKKLKIENIHLSHQSITAL